ETLAAALDADEPHNKGDDAEQERKRRGPHADERTATATAAGDDTGDTQNHRGQRQADRLWLLLADTYLIPLVHLGQPLLVYFVPTAARFTLARRRFFLRLDLVLIDGLATGFLHDGLIAEIKRRAGRRRGRLLGGRIGGGDRDDGAALGTLALFAGCAVR